MSKNFFEAIKKSYDAQAIQRDTYNLKDYAHDFGEVKKGVSTKPARARIKALIAKWVVSSKLENRDGAGYRTTIVLENGETIGTFSMAAQRFMETMLDMTGSVLEGKFQRLDIDGYIEVDISIIPLEDSKTTYEFVLVDGQVGGFVEERPAQLLMGSTVQALPEAADVTPEEAATE